MPPYFRSMEASFLSVTIPTSWQEVTDEQLYYVFRLLGKGIPTERVMMYAFMRLAGLHIVKEQNGSVLIVRKGNKAYPIRKEDLQYGALRLEFLEKPSDYPVRLSTYKGKAAVDAELHEFPFGHYLQVENYFQAFLQTNEDECIAAIATLLYPDFAGKPDETLQYNLLSWIYGIKQHFAREFSDLFRTVPQKSNENEENNFPDMKAITEAEIRALNGGDITKTKEIFEADTWGALAELNAKAREEDLGSMCICFGTSFASYDAVH